MLESVIRRAPVLTVRLALAHVRTLAGAQRIYRAERSGLNRPEVLRAAEQRVAKLGGEVPERAPRLLDVGGRAIEAPKPRILEAVGRGRRHPGW